MSQDNGSSIPYITMTFIYILSFISIYYYATVLLGVFVLYTINVIATMFILKDMFLFSKVNDPVFIVLFIPIVLNIISSTMIGVTLKSLHSRYNKKDKSIKLTNHYTDVISNYFAMFITTIVFNGLLVYFYFTEPIGIPYIDYNFVGMGVSPRWLIFKLVLKLVLIATNLGLSSYMVYSAHTFTKLMN